MGVAHFIVTFGLVFVPLTGVVAYIIAREEYEQHTIAPRKAALMSLGAGLCVAAIMAGPVILDRYLLSGYLVTNFCDNQGGRPMTTIAPWVGG